MITVRQATLKDRPSLFEFIKKAYAGRWQYKIPERWDWEFVDNPFLEGRGLPVYIAVEDDGRVVGQTATLVEPVKIGHEEHRLGWSVDTYLLPEYRGQGIGFQLQKANDEDNSIFMSLSMSKANRKIKAGLGSVPLNPVPDFIRLGRYEVDSVHTAVLARLTPKEGPPRKLVSAALRLSLADRIASAILNAGWSVYEHASLPDMPAGLTITEMGMFGAEIDHLWEKLSHNFYAIVRRNSEYLNWKYNLQPHVHYRKFVAWRGEEPLGYVILRPGQPPERKIGILTDLFASPEDSQTIDALLGFSMGFFQRARVKDVRVASSVPAYQERLEALGFHRYAEATPMLHCKLDTPACMAAADPGCWFLSKGDHDWDQYPLAH